MPLDRNSPEFKTAFNKLSQDAQRMVLENPESVLLEIALREQKWPTKNAIPNIAQERSLACFMAPHPTYEGRYPFIIIFRGGNGTGKTADMAFLIAGCVLGPYFMNKEFFNHQYFQECDKLRKKRKFKLRIVCDKTDMQENGSVHTLIKYWIPCAEFKGKTSGGYYTEIKIPAPSPDYQDTIIDVKTFDMDVESHSGSEYDLIVFNEPPPQDLYTENISRLRKGGRAAFFLTPLNQAAYLKKIENGDYPDGEMYITKGSIWENCADIPGTRGVLSRINIERMKRQWYEKDPLEVPAREFGEYISLAGAVFPIFSDHVHVVDPMVIQPNWNIYKILDPHDKKPPFCVYIAVTPLNQCYVFAEYPVENWEVIKTTYLTIKNFVMEFERIQGGQHEQFNYVRERLRIFECLGDPNKFSDRQPGTGKTMKEEYEWAGNESIFTKINDDIKFGHEAIKNLILYDPERKVDSMNHPQLRIFRSCKNVIRAFKNYEWAEKQGVSEGLSDKIDHKWACPMSCIRYFAVHFNGYQQMSKDRYDEDMLIESEQNVDNFDDSSYINNGIPMGRFI
jgi:phage terminase large subunit-like protein